ncbi:hypothetical protein CC86DRAFT_407680 [Ophiobolus disseminans]|uniref:Uncharacterized protein n=1 Tax=Ophiobolus disseminans TaxID=1469910 RepID=A0A6A6ZWN7_9PLEO|nr:hypothetical protein CC86DRAFT_407680 [Ophiobolus disseminans]
MTPDHPRKSSRLRDMFKSRSSLSPSTHETSKKLLVSGTASPPATPISPTIKIGFEQVGLLPSERSSFAEASSELEHNGGARVAEVLMKQREELKGQSIPHNVDTALDTANVGHSDEIAKRVMKQEKDNEANVIAEAFQDALMKHKEEATQGEATGVENDGNMDRPGDEWRTSHLADGSDHRNCDSTERPSSSAVLGEADLSHKPASGFHLPNAFGVLSEKKSTAHNSTLSHPYRVSAGDCSPSLAFEMDGGPHPSTKLDTGSKQTLRAVDSQWKTEFNRSSTEILSNVADETFVDTDDDQELRCSPRGSFASNIFDNQDPFSKGIREYVASKIAEAMVEYDSQNVGEPRNTFQDTEKPVQIHFRIDISGLARKIDTKLSKPENAHDSVRTSAKHIGPYQIDNSRLAFVLQRGIVGLYLLVATTAFGGKSVFGILVSLLFIFIATFVLSLCEENPGAKEATDLVLAPMLVPWAYLGRFLQEAASKAARSGVGVMFDALGEVAEVTEVHMKTE